MPVAKLTVLEVRQKAFLVRAPGSPTPLWLPRSQVMPVKPPDASGHRHRHRDPEFAGEEMEFSIPSWLWERHRQLCGDKVYDERRRERDVR